MSSIKYFPKDLNIENKTIILRLDFNVPMKDKIILDDTRIISTLPFLNELIRRKSKIIILTHLGRPKGKRDSSLSLLPIFKYLKETIKTNIFFFTGEIGSELKDKTSHLKPSEILLLENMRFYKGEEENDKNFAKQISSLGDIYVNDAFSCSHRKQASIHQVAKFANKSFAGPLLENEIKAINIVLSKKKGPVTCIIGGSKISTKINIISNLMKNVDKIIIVGAMANNFLVYDGFNIGKSLIEKNSNNIIKQIYLNVKNLSCEIIIPKDFNVSESFESEGNIKKIGNIYDNEIILDIGPETIGKIEDVIDASSTVLWNGPAGYFENENFSKGTLAIAKKISENTLNKSLISILGGGDTISAINKNKTKLNFTHLSTAGGAFLEYLEGKDLPGISVLK